MTSSHLNKIFNVLLLSSLLICSNKVLADESSSVFGVSLGMTYEDGIEVLKERDMFSHIALGNAVLGKNYKKCSHFLSSSNFQKACKNLDFRPTKLSKEEPQSEWKISEIEYTQGLAPPINEQILLENLEKRYGKLTLSFEGGKEDVRRLYYGINNARFSAKDIESASDLVRNMMSRGCKDKVKLVEVSTMNKYKDTFNYQIVLHDLTRKCKQKTAIEAYKRKMEQRKIDKQLKLD